MVATVYPNVVGKCVYRPCYKRVPLQNPRLIRCRNGRPVWQGTCPLCGRKVNVITSDNELAKQGLAGPT